MSKLVKGVGPRDANIVILGEAPGKNEAKQGKPFVGRSGKLLNKLLAEAGILRQTCYLTNVVKERPPGNNIKKFIDLSKKKPKISKDGRYYLDSLQRELAKLNPNVIVPLGNVPLWALTSEKGITKWRGSILEGPLGLKTIPTIHPAAALRQYVYRYYILMDLRQVKEESKTPEINLTKRQYILEPTLDESLTYLDNCLGKPLVGFDIEVNSKKEVSCISFSYSKNHAISIPFLNKRGACYFLHEQEKAVWTAIAKVLSDPDTKKVAHNASFDSTFLYRKYNIIPRNIEDTMIAQGLLYPDFKKGLGFVTTQYTDIPYYKDEGKEAMKAQNNMKFWRYNARDSIVLVEAFPKQKKELEKQKNWETYESQRDLLEPLTFMTEVGMRVDIEGLKEKRKKAAKRLSELKDKLVEITGRVINPKSPTQLKQYFYGDEPGDLGLDAYKNRSTGRPTTNETALKRLSRRGFEAAEVLLEYRGLSKMNDTYYNMSFHKDGRMRSSFNPIGTTTGRLSSSKDIFGKGGNMQNLPVGFKKHIIPDPGQVLYEIDLGQAENRVVAYLGSDLNMIEAFENGQDIHCKTAALIFGKDLEEVMQLKKEWEAAGKPPGPNRFCPDIGQGTKPYRYWGKQANHAFNYDMGYRKASLMWEIPEKEARWIYNQYHGAYKGVKRFHKRVNARLNRGRTVENLFGRKRQFLGRWNKIKKDAYSFMAQSTVADIINRYDVCGIYYNQDLFHQVTLLLQIHDSVLFQIPKDLGWPRHEELISEICSMMEPQLNYKGKSFTIPAEVTIMPKHAAYGHEFSSRPSASKLKKAYNTFEG